MSITLVLTETEQQVLVNLLNQLHDHQAAAGCNDFTLPATPENRVLAEAVETFEGYDHTYVVDKDGMLYLTDWMITDYFIDRLGGDSEEGEK